MKKLKLKFISFLLILSFLISSITPVFANDIVYNTEFENFINNSVFDVDKMNDIEKSEYFKLIEEQVNLASEKYGSNFNKEWFRNELRFVLETENSFELLKEKDYSDEKIFRDGTWVPDVKIKNSVAAAAIDIVINSVLIATGVGTVTALIKEVGISQARRIFTSNLKTKLAGWGLQKLAAYLPFAVDFIFNILDPSEAIVNYLDSKDDFPNNGYLDIVL